MTEAFLNDQFLARLHDLPGSEANRAARENAMSAFNSAGYPTRKWEDWRYTDLKPIASANYDPIPGTPSQDTTSQARQLIDELDLNRNYHQIVFIDGHRAADFGPPPNQDGLEISDLNDAWDRIMKPRGATAYESRPLAALNTAFAASGICLHVAENTRIEEPIHLIFVASDRPSIAQQPRVTIDLEPGSSLQVVQHFIGSAQCASWTNAVMQITLGTGAGLKLNRLQNHDVTHLHTELLTAELAADSNFELGYIDLGGALVRNDAQINLAGPGARCDLFGVFVANDGQHIDNHIRIDHSAPSTVSRETFKSIIGDRGRGVFNGKVVVHKNAQKTDAQQSSDNLLLSDRGEIDTKPELEIYADDVKCSHGATVGQLDQEQLFYLRARGVDDMTARGLLTFAFANEILQRLQIPELRERITREVLSRLPGRQQWDELL